MGLRVLDIVARNNLIHQAQYMGEKLRAGLLQLQRRIDCIGDVRGRGLMVGIEIVADSSTKAPAILVGHAVAERMKALGLWVHFSDTASVFQLSPPIIMTEVELASGLEIMEEAFQNTLETLH